MRNEHKWPIIGTVSVGATQAILAFRSLTVDVATCGAVDNIVSLSLSTMSGTLQLHNDRNNFSNSSSISKTDCTPAPAFDAAPFASKGPKDFAGN